MKGVFVSDTHKIIYIFIPKCACTTLKSVICNMEPKIKLKLTGREKSRQVEGIYGKYVKNMSDQELLKKHQKGYIIFTFIRDPIARIKSLYKEKVVGYLFPPFKSMGITKGMSFNQFVKKISNIPDHRSNNHFRSQHTFLVNNKTKQLLPFVQVGFVENFDEDLKRILKHKYKDEFKNLHFRKTKSKEVIIDESSLKMLKNRYKRDLDIINEYKIINNSIQTKLLNIENENENKFPEKKEYNSTIKNLLEKENKIHQEINNVPTTPNHNILSKKILKKMEMRSMRKNLQKEKEKKINKSENASRTFISKKLHLEKKRAIIDPKLLELLTKRCKIYISQDDWTKKSGKDTIILTFSDKKYKKIAEKWCNCVKDLGINNYVVAACDMETVTYLSARGFNASLVPKGNCRNFWNYRMTVIKYLINQGMNIIHSDADAFWYKDPRQEYFQTNADCIVSQGTFLPMHAYHKWRFVMCCGLMYFKCSAQGKMIVSKTFRHMNRSNDDQVSLNTVLINSTWDWKKDNLETFIFRNKKIKTPSKKVLSGYNKEFKAHIEILPHRLFQRVKFSQKDAYVCHHIEGKKNIHKKIRNKKT